MFSTISIPKQTYKNHQPITITNPITIQNRTHMSNPTITWKTPQYNTHKDTSSDTEYYREAEDESTNGNSTSNPESLSETQTAVPTYKAIAASKSKNTIHDWWGRSMERGSNYSSSWENQPEILCLWNIKHNGSTSMTIEFDNIDEWQQTKKINNWQSRRPSGNIHRTTCWQCIPQPNKTKKKTSRVTLMGEEKKWRTRLHITTVCYKIQNDWGEPKC